MPDLFFRMLGGVFGVLVAHAIMCQTILSPQTGEGAIAQSMWFWFGGWAIVLSYYSLGAAIGFAITIPVIDLIGTLVLTFRDWVTDRRH